MVFEKSLVLVFAPHILFFTLLSPSLSPHLILLFQFPKESILGQKLNFSWCSTSDLFIGPSIWQVCIACLLTHSLTLQARNTPVDFFVFKCRQNKSYDFQFVSMNPCSSLFFLCLMLPNLYLNMTEKFFPCSSALSALFRMRLVLYGKKYQFGLPGAEFQRTVIHKAQ